MLALGSWRPAAGSLVLAALLAGCGEKDVEIAPVQYKGPLAETTNVESVKVTFYDKPGKAIVNTLEANYAKSEKSTQLYTMRGKVRMESMPEQQIVTSEEVFYDKLKRKIYTDTAMFVRVQSPTQVLLGYGLVANEDLSRYTIKRPTGTFTLEEAKAQGK
jgi:LPS export ABC transporter protein LptC